MAGTPSHSTQYDLIAVGETMAGFVSRDDPRRFVLTPAGAESNVAIGMAQLGFRVRWVSRVGDDPLGRLVAASIEAAGVDVAVEFDPARQTGVLVKHIGGTASRVDYYRSQSAATTLDPQHLERAGSARLWHVTGITPALSESARDLVEAVVSKPRRSGEVVSFDVNLRPKLWSSVSAATETLVPLVHQADVIFVGDDEAELMFGTAEPRIVAARLLQRDDQQLVLKHGAVGATLITTKGEVFEPALPATVVDVTGAGDAFAAGYLAGMCWDWPAHARLRLGHYMASRVITSIEDVTPPLSASEKDKLATLRG
ncbi:MAG: sugar kinase [Acidimicrobiia bacterium]